MWSRFVLLCLPQKLGLMNRPLFPHSTGACAIMTKAEKASRSCFLILSAPFLCLHVASGSACSVVPFFLRLICFSLSSTFSQLCLKLLGYSIPSASGSTCGLEDLSQVLGIIRGSSPMNSQRSKLSPS